MECARDLALNAAPVLCMISPSRDQQPHLTVLDTLEVRIHSCD
jgi:hypothetical protein